MSAAQVDRSSRWIVKRLLRASFLADIQVTYHVNDRVHISYGVEVDNGDAIEHYSVTAPLSSFPTPDELFQTLLLFGFELIQMRDNDFVDGVLSDEVVQRYSPSEVVRGDTVHLMYGADNVGSIQWSGGEYE